MRNPIKTEYKPRKRMWSETGKDATAALRRAIDYAYENEASVELRQRKPRHKAGKA